MKTKKPLRSQHNRAKENKSWKTKKNFTGFYTEINPTIMCLQCCVHLSSSPSPGPTTNTTTCDHFPQFSFSCDKAILLEISARDRSCFLWSVNFLEFVLAALSKVFRKAVLSLMKERASRLAIVQLPSSSLLPYFVSFCYTGETLTSGLKQKSIILRALL